jgi:superfamily II DNA helicase RecQ
MSLYKFFRIPVHDRGEFSGELNAFLGANRVIKVEKEFLGPPICGWNFCVEYLPHGKMKPRFESASEGAVKIDYREVLSADEFQVYSRLRELRKQISDAEGIPVYTIYKNEHLAAMVQQKVKDRAELGAIDGVGESRIKKYGDRFLECLREDDGTPPSADGQPEERAK